MFIKSIIASPSYPYSVRYGQWSTEDFQDDPDYDSDAGFDFEKGDDDDESRVTGIRIRRRYTGRGQVDPNITSRV